MKGSRKVIQTDAPSYLSLDPGAGAQRTLLVRVLLRRQRDHSDTAIVSAAGSGSDAPTLDFVRGRGSGLATVALALTSDPTFHVFLFNLDNNVDVE